MAEGAGVEGGRVRGGQELGPGVLFLSSGVLEGVGGEGVEGFELGPGG